MAFVQRFVDVEFQIGPATSAQPITSPLFPGNKNTARVTGLRCSVQVQNATNIDIRANISIWGLPLSIMNSISTLGMAYQLVPNNFVNVYAGTVEPPTALMFSGNILQAYMDLQNPPDVPFRVEAQPLANQSALLISPISNSVPADIPTIAEQLARKMGCTLENSANISGSVPSCYLWGSPKAMMQQFADTAGIRWTVENNNLNGGTVAIWPKGGARNIGVSGPPLISADTGMIGYPTFTINGVLFKTLFNPSLKLGGQVEIQSQVLKSANGIYNVYKLDHTLESKVFHGKWETLCEAWNPKTPYKIGSQGPIE